MKKIQENSWLSKNINETIKDIANVIKRKGENYVPATHPDETKGKVPREDSGAGTSGASSSDPAGGQ